MQTTQNQYLTETQIKFIETYTKRRELEVDFNPLKLHEYEEVNNLVYKYASELVKCGAEFYIDKENDVIQIIIDEVSYDVDLEGVGNHLDTTSFQLMISQANKNEEERERRKEEAEQKAKDEEDRKKSDESDFDNSEAKDSFVKIMGAFFSTFMDMRNQNVNMEFAQGSGTTEEKPQTTEETAIAPIKKETSLFDDVIEIQKKIMRLEQAKSLVESQEEMSKKEIERLEEEIHRITEVLKEKEEEIASLKNDNKCFEELMESLGEEADASAKEKQELQRKLDEKRNQIANKSNECESLKNSLNKANQEIEKCKNELQALEKKLSEVNSELDKKIALIKEITSQNEITAEELKKANEKIAQLEKDISDEREKLHKKEQSDSEQEKNFAKEKKSHEEDIEKLDKTKKDLEALQKTLEEIKKENNSLRSKNQSFEKRISDKDAEIRKLKSNPVVVDEETARKTEELTSENNRLKRELERLKAQPSPEQVRKNDAVYEEKIAMLTRLAYMDERCEVKNENAFNVDFPKTEKDKITVSMVGICNMKIFNNTFGRSKGNAAIKKVAQKLKDAFPTSDIYRIMGDQFTIISTDANIVTIKDKLSEIESELEKEMINIVFGCVDGVTCKDHETTLKQAEAIMKQMKNRSGKSSLARKNLAKLDRTAKVQDVPSFDIQPAEDNNEPSDEEEVVAETEYVSDDESTDEFVNISGEKLLESEAEELSDDDEIEFTIETEATVETQDKKSTTSSTEDDDDEIDFDIDYDDLMSDIEDDED